MWQVIGSFKEQLKFLWRLFKNYSNYLLSFFDKKSKTKVVDGNGIVKGNIRVTNRKLVQTNNKLKNTFKAMCISTYLVIFNLFIYLTKRFTLWCFVFNKKKLPPSSHSFISFNIALANWRQWARHIKKKGNPDNTFYPGFCFILERNINELQIFTNMKPKKNKIDANVIMFFSLLSSEGVVFFFCLSFK